MDGKAFACGAADVPVSVWENDFSKRKSSIEGRACDYILLGEPKPSADDEPDEATKAAIAAATAALRLEEDHAEQARKDKENNPGGAKPDAAKPKNKPKE
jgi:hypothetical protein